MSGPQAEALARRMDVLGRAAALRRSAPSTWTAKAMRTLLVLAGEDPSGCFERSELVSACQAVIQNHVAQFPAIKVTENAPRRPPPLPTLCTSAPTQRTAAARKPSAVAAAAVATSVPPAEPSKASNAVSANSASSTTHSQQPTDSAEQQLQQPHAAGDTAAQSGAGNAARGGCTDADADDPAFAASEAAKAKGNAAFASGEFPKAVQHYTMAIRIAPKPSAALFSNRSAAYASMSYFGKAEADAREVSCDASSCTWYPSFLQFVLLYPFLPCPAMQAVAAYMKNEPHALLCCVKLHIPVCHVHAECAVLTCTNAICMHACMTWPISYLVCACCCIRYCTGMCNNKRVIIHSLHSRAYACLCACVWMDGVHVLVPGYEAAAWVG
jgi:tetratricopeptide (TPR) repeat protein